MQEGPGRLFDDLAARQRGNGWKQTRGEQKQGRKRAKRERYESEENLLMASSSRDRHQVHEDNFVNYRRKLFAAGKREHLGMVTSQIKEARTI